jgi:hypothetical protein
MKTAASTPTGITSDAAIKLASGLRRQNGGTFQLRADVLGDRIIFTGGTKGAHSLALDVSSKARILAHWEGYCEANGMPMPKLGERIRFVGNTGKVYVGTVTKIGTKRVSLDFHYRHGGAAHTSVPVSDLLFRTI